MKVSTEIDNNFGYEKITQLVDNIPLKVIAPHMTKDVIDNYTLVQSPIKSCDELMYINQSNRFLGLSQQFFTCTSYFLLISVKILNVYCYYFILLSLFHVYIL